MMHQLLSSPPPPPSSPATTHHHHHHHHHLRLKLSRRELSAAAATTLPLLLRPSPSQANDAIPPSPPPTDTRHDPTPTLTAQTAFLDVSIDAAPAGRITIALDTTTSPLAASRFTSLLNGAAGITYRRKAFTKITPNYLQHAGVRSYGVDADIAKTAGSELAADGLMAEWEAADKETVIRCVKGTVGLVVRDPARLPPKAKLVARKGRLEVEEEEVGAAPPNGTEFVIAVRDSPELDAAAVVVGRVVGGWDVVERIARVKTVQENTSSPYFRVAKLIGDKRAVVAERGFNRPYSKVMVTNCGLIDQSYP